ncbi:MAG: ABC transporter permease [Chitinophaga sp.]|uniref:ABC transporter permease n=1 Tax=Chitinophaga sp. TaxID=1869181 RepID=UPI0025C4937E|nr:ABC transporter permease [Chitinophaga sp.]MBV8251549.1 ABC transporter permease [Chitinophaga sp.]
MFKHNLHLIFRQFKRFKSVFVINLVGLSTGLAAAILIFLWVNDEGSTDKFHHNSDHLFQVMVNTTQDGRITTDEGTGGILGETLEREVPEVASAVTTAPAAWFQKFNVSFNTHTLSAKGNFVGSSYFQVFSFELLQGDKSQVLSNKTGIVLSETLARNLFHTTDNIVGKVIEWKWASFTKQCIVMGVYKDMPFNSTQQYDFVLPLDAWKDIVPATNDLAGGPFRTYVVLKDGTNTAPVQQKISSFISDKIKGSNATLFLRNYADAYLYGKYENGKLAGGRIAYIRLFIIIAIAILLIACINFMNLSTARASGRMKEVGVKKALGIKPYMLMVQFLGESVLMSFISMILAILLMLVLLPQFNQITGKHLRFGWHPGLLAAILGITLLTGLLAGSYPAFYLSSFKPVITLKGKLISSVGALWVRRGSVIFQFVICVLFVSAMMVVYKQIQYVQTKDLGYNKENVVYFELEGRAAAQRDAFLAELNNMPGVIGASSIQQKVILPSSVPNSVIQWDGKNANGDIRFCEMPVNYGLLETLGIQMAKGRAFSRQYSTDMGGIVLNEAAIAAMNLTGDPIGKIVNLNGKDTRIIGVSKNFHFNSLHDEIKPFIFRLSPDETMLVMARIQAGKTAATIQRVEQYYKDFNPGYTFDYQFLDMAYQQQYASEQLVASLAKYFTGLAIIISCLGLFGLAAFTVERRAKEIGVRKVMGATAANIVYLLSIDFTKIILVAIVLALPLSYFVTRNWLDSFAYRIHLSAGYFVAAAVIALLVAWCTIGLQTIKASRVNPLLYLKEE